MGEDVTSRIRRYVALAHGIWDTSKVFRRMRNCLEDNGYHCVVVDFSPSDGSDGLEVAARQLKAAIEAEVENEASLDLIGFSMGGIVGRYYLQRLGGLDRVRRFLTLSSPHGGSWTCLAPMGKGVKQMRRESDFLKDLDADAERLRAVKFTSFYTKRDLMVIPASSSRTHWSFNRAFSVWWHSWMLVDTGVHEAVLEFLGEEEI